MSKLFKFFTVVTLLSFAVHADSQDNPVFEQLKDDMWEMGLEFNYTNYEHVISPIKEHKESPNQGDIIEVEEVSRALYL